MNNIIALVQILKGRKSYIVGTLEIVLGLLTGNNEMILLGFSTITLRAGMK